jgi:cell division protein FtsZ
VTIVATGLGGAAAQRQPALSVVTRTGTDNQPVAVDYDELDQPTAFRHRRRETVDALKH